MGKEKCRPATTSPSKRPRAAVGYLLLIDDAPIRRAALASYFQLESRGAKMRARIERYETVDRPAYERWEASTLGPLLTELRERSAALREKERVLDALEEEMFRSNCSQLTAYRRLMKLLNEREEEPAGCSRDDFCAADNRENPDLVSDACGMFGRCDLPPGFRVEDYDRMSEAWKREFRATYERLAELYEGMTGQSAPPLDEVLARERARSGGADPEAIPRNAASAPREESPNARLKELYRKIVRQLHPDTNGEFAPRERELWHEAQAAYRERDLERLEAVAARIELSGASASLQTPVSVLLRIIRELRAALRSVRHLLALAKKQPAWRFQERAAELPEMEARRRRNLAIALGATQRKLASATAILEDLARRAAQPRTARAQSGASDMALSGG